MMDTPIHNLMDPIPSGSKSEVIIQRITDSIISGALKPGDKIPTEQDFCDQLKIGRNTVREAIKVLVAFGVLEIRRSEGTFVTDHFTPKLMDPMLYGLILFPKNLYDLLEFKIAIWTAVISAGITAAAEEDVVHLRKLYNQFAVNAQKPEPDQEALFRCSEAFHKYLGELTHNPLLEQLNELNVKFSAETRRRSIEIRTKYHQLNNTLKEYNMILELLERRDKSKLTDTMDWILESWKRQFAQESGNA